MYIWGIYSIYAWFQTFADCLEMDFPGVNEDYYTWLSIPHVFHHLVAFLCVLKNIPLFKCATVDLYIHPWKHILVSS